MVYFMGYHGTPYLNRWFGGYHSLRETSISVCLKIVYPDICYFNEKNDDLHMDLGLAYFPTSPYKKENGRRISMERQHLR